MCGIAGFINFNGRVSSPLEIEEMMAAISHRGPDGDGVLIREPVYFGHRRLSIIDLEGGRQPMCNEDSSVWITYNGELYNYKELRKLLKAAGHIFKTDSDTEVIIHAYEEWGPECVKKFRGMFAFVIADYQKKILFLSRDHFGIKPLFYRLGQNYFAFGSELSVLRRVHDIPPEGSLQSIDYFLRYQYIPHPHTIYKNINKLPPATYLIINFEGKTVMPPTVYWDINFEPIDGRSRNSWVDEGESVITESVSSHLVSDVPFGVFLSGGIDSSLVAMKMNELLGGGIKAFTIGFEEDEYSEVSYAKTVANKFNMDIQVEFVKGEQVDLLPELLDHYGEPFGDSSALPSWQVSKLARGHVPMVLSGDGGDEGFGGYTTHWHYFSSAIISQILRVAPSNPRLAISWLRKLRWLPNQTNNLDDWVRYILYLHLKTRSALWRPEFQKLVCEPCEVFEAAHAKARGYDRLGYAQYLDYKTYLPNDILTKMDIASMCHGLEVRTPLIDVKVVEFASRLPISMRMGHGREMFSAPDTGKFILKEILGRTFNSDFVYRKKQGFAIPRHQWFLEGGKARKMLNEIVSEPNSKLLQIFNRNQIISHINAHTRNNDNSHVLWLLLVLGTWMKINADVTFS